MTDLQKFFENPSWISLLGIVAFLAYSITMEILKKSKAKAEKENQKKHLERQETNYMKIDRLADAVETLINQQTNRMNLMTTEMIITAKLNESKATIINEIQRIFEHNHRDNANRKKYIKTAIKNVTLACFERDIKALSNLYYKNVKLADFLINIPSEQFYKQLLELLFTTNGNPETELKDIIYFLDSSFESFILKGKKFFNNI